MQYPQRIMPVHFSPSRRDVLSAAGVGLGAITLGGSLAACGGGSSSGEGSLNVLSYGGPVAETAKTMLTTRMKNEHDVGLTVTTGATVEPQINSTLDTTEFDVFTGNVLFIPTYPEIWAEMDYDQVPNSENCYPNLLQACQGYSTPAWLHTACIVYNSERFSSPPTLADFTDPKNKGKVALQASPYTLDNFAPMLLEELGGSPDNPEPMFDWLEKVIPNKLTDYQQVTQAAQLFQNGDIDLALWYSGRAADLRKSGVPVDWINDGSVATLNTLALVPNSTSDTAAYQLMNEWLTPKFQKTMSLQSGFSPVVTNVEMTEEELKDIAVRPEEVKNVLTPDWAKYGKYKEEWQKRYNEMVQK